MSQVDTDKLKQWRFEADLWTGDDYLWLNRFKEAYALLIEQRKANEELREQVDGMARAPYGEFAKMRDRALAAEAEVVEQREALEARDRLFNELYAKPHRAEEIAARYAALSRLEAST